MQLLAAQCSLLTHDSNVVRFCIACEAAKQAEACADAREDVAMFATPTCRHVMCQERWKERCGIDPQGSPLQSLPDKVCDTACDAELSRFDCRDHPALEDIRRNIVDVCSQARMETGALRHRQSETSSASGRPELEADAALPSIPDQKYGLLPVSLHFRP